MSIHAYNQKVSKSHEQITKNWFILNNFSPNILTGMMDYLFRHEMNQKISTLFYLYQPYLGGIFSVQIRSLVIEPVTTIWRLVIHRELSIECTVTSNGTLLIRHTGTKHPPNCPSFETFKVYLARIFHDFLLRFISNEVSRFFPNATESNFNHTRTWVVSSKKQIMYQIHLILDLKRQTSPLT